MSLSPLTFGVYMPIDPHVAIRKKEYAALMQEARDEYLVWEREMQLTTTSITDLLDPHAVVKNAKISVRTCACGQPAVRGGKCDPCRIIARASNHSPCACGNPYFARGMCSKCYYKMYNKIRTRRRLT